MKKYPKTITRSIFLLAVLFCVGIHLFSNSDVRSSGFEHASDANGITLIFGSHIDSFDDDQINQPIDISTLTEHDCQMQIPLNCFLHHNFFGSLWQPPKNS
jgi:hypothetical protein